MTIEYRIKKVERFIITRHEDNAATGSTRQIGNEYDNAAVAYEVGYALCRAEHDRLGFVLGSSEIIYPGIPDGVSKAPTQTVESAAYLSA